MKGLQNIFAATHIVLWQTEYGWDTTHDILYIAAIVVDTSHFQEVQTFEYAIKTPFNLQPEIVVFNLFQNKEPVITIQSTLSVGIKKFLDWARGYDIYSWGDDIRFFAQNLDLAELTDSPLESQFYDIKNLFRAYGVPADQYVSSTIIEYFDRGHLETKSAQTTLDNCRMLASALKRLAQTV